MIGDPHGKEGTPNMAQPRASKNTQKEEQPRMTAADLALDDDDFFDLPPYEPHVPTPKAPKAPKAPRSREDSAKILLTVSRLLMTLAIACLITAVVVGIAHAGILPGDPPADTEDGQPEDGQPNDEQPDSGTPDDAPDISDTIATPPPFPAETYTVDVSAFMTAIEYLPEKKDILLLNKQHPVGESFKPSTLITLPTGYTYGGKMIQLDATAAIALQAMMLCMRADGITDTYVTSGYRSYSYQLSTFENHVQDELQKNPNLTREEAVKIVETYSAHAGYSEHQSGLCVDFMTIHMDDLVNEQFEPTTAFAWLQENAAEFGFILRYPADKTDVTGYSYESWHYRFVGRAAALEITSHGITLEEYLGQAQ